MTTNPKFRLRRDIYEILQKQHYIKSDLFSNYFCQSPVIISALIKSFCFFVQIYFPPFHCTCTKSAAINYACLLCDTYNIYTGQQLAVFTISHMIASCFHAFSLLFFYRRVPLTCTILCSTSRRFSRV